MGIVLWFTGLSGSGKTTIALELKKNLISLGKKVEILDGDAVRNTLYRHLGFTKEDISENNHLIALLAKEKMSRVDFILVSIISPFKIDRLRAKNLLGSTFMEFFINCPLKKCIEKDTKGLYTKALAGEIDNLIGLSSANPYEIPEQPDLEIKTDQTNLDESIKKIIFFLKVRGVL